MKLTFSRFLVENAGEAPNVSTIKNNLGMCIEHERFIFRGSETAHDGFGEKEKRTSRTSLTNSNVIMNFTSLYFDHLPNRKKSYFGTNSPSNATDFGSIFVIVPHDDVKEFAIVPNDFNLRENPVLDEIKTGLDFSGFGFQFVYSLQKICAGLKQKQSQQRVEELDEVITRLSNDHEDVEKKDFEDFDLLFNEVFSSGEPYRVLDYSHDAKFAWFVWEVVSSKYDGSFIRFIKHAIQKGTEDIKVVSLDEVLKMFQTDETFEVWFEGRCSYFNMDWLNEQYQKLNDNEDADIVNDANDEEGINLAIAEVLRQYI